VIQETLAVGPLQCNCVILGCERTREAVVIDPGDEAERIVRAITSAGLSVKYLLHTHAHFDHVGATREVKKAAGGAPCLHRDDEFLYTHLPMQGQLFGFRLEEAPPVEKFLEDGETVVFGDHRMEVIHTPGHSPGGLCFRLETGGAQWLFSGDTLFDHSVGRTDLWGGDGENLTRSIRTRIFTLDDETRVQPGHGPQTLVGVEKRENPFLR